MYFVQGVFKYTDSGIRRRLDKDIANSDRRERQYRVLVKKSTERLHAFGSRLFRGKTLVLAVSQSFLEPLSSIRSQKRCLYKELSYHCRPSQYISARADHIVCRLRLYRGCAMSILLEIGDNPP